MICISIQSLCNGLSHSKCAFFISSAQHSSSCPSDNQEWSFVNDFSGIRWTKVLDHRISTCITIYISSDCFECTKLLVGSASETLNLEWCDYSHRRNHSHAILRYLNETELHIFHYYFFCFIANRTSQIIEMFPIQIVFFLLVSSMELTLNRFRSMFTEFPKTKKLSSAFDINTYHTNVSNSKC